MAKQKTIPSIRETWPEKGTLIYSVLRWMESGKPYKAVLMASRFNTYPPAISRAKAFLIRRGKWRWGMGRSYRNIEIDDKPLFTNHYRKKKVI